MKLFGMKSATFVTESHDLHRRRRAALNASFSKATITALEPEIRDLVDKLCTRLKEFQKSGEPAELGLIFAALTADVVTQYAFGNRYGCLDAPDFNPMLYKAVQANIKTSTLAKQFGWLVPLSRAMPHWMVNAMNPLMLQMIYFANVRINQLLSASENLPMLRIVHPLTRNSTL
jgi:cytochrome P450